MDWSHQTHRQQAPPHVCCAILTISDTRSEADDKSGQSIKKLLVKQGHSVASYALVADNAEAIEKQLKIMLAISKVRAIVLSGGTGIAGRDRTIQTISAMLTKPLPGFGEIFRMLSYQQVGAAAMLSRALAGAIDDKLVFALPGSLKAVNLAMQKLILPELSHAVYELSKQS